MAELRDNEQAMRKQDHCPANQAGAHYFRKDATTGYWKCRNEGCDEVRGRLSTEETTELNDESR